MLKNIFHHAIEQIYVIARFCVSTQACNLYLYMASNKQRRFFAFARDTRSLTKQPQTIFLMVFGKVWNRPCDVGSACSARKGPDMNDPMIVLNIDEGPGPKKPLDKWYAKSQGGIDHSREDFDKLVVDMKAMLDDDVVVNGQPA